MWWLVPGVVAVLMARGLVRKDRQPSVG